MIRSVHAVPARKVRDLAAPDRACISVTAPGYPEANVGDFGHVLRLQVSDLDRAPGDAFREVYGEPVLFDAAMATEIWRWWRALPGSVEVLVVHCDLGVSRSPAIAEVIADECGATLHESKFAAPNALIERILREAI